MTSNTSYIYGLMSHLIFYHILSLLNLFSKTLAFSMSQFDYQCHQEPKIFY